MTVRNIKKSLAGVEDIATGIGTLQQERGAIHRVNVFPSSYSYIDMRQYEGGDFFRLYGSDTFYTDYRRNPAGTVGIPAGAGGVWEPLTNNDKTIGGNTIDGAYLVDETYLVWHAGTASYYGWTGVFPHAVAPGTDPAAVGSGYVPRTDVLLRGQLASASGALLVGTDDGRTVQARLSAIDAKGARFKTVMDYGAVGDGVADDTAAILACAAGEGYALLPPGVYAVGSMSLTKPLVFSAGAVLQVASGATATLTSVTAEPVRIFTGGGAVAGLSGETVYVEWWGAAGDGTTSDAAAFNAAVSGGHRTVQLLDPVNGYRLGAAVNMAAANTSIVGVSTRTRIVHGGDFDLFALAANDLKIENLWVDCQSVTTALKYVFRHRSSLGSWQRHEITNVISFQARGFGADDGGTGSLISMFYRDCIAKKHSGPGLVFARAFGYLHFHNVTIDYVGSSLPSYNAFNISGNQGVLFDNCDVTGSAGAGTGATASQAGFVLNNCSGVWFRKAQADTVEGRGYELIACSGVQFYDAVASLCASGVGFYFSGCTAISGSIRASGRKGLSYAPSGVHGVALEGDNSTFRVDVQSNNSTGDGVNITGSPIAVMLGSVQAINNSGVGVRTGSSGSVHIGTASLGSNAGGNYNIGGGFHGIARAQLNSGAFQNNISGPATA